MRKRIPNARAAAIATAMCLLLPGFSAAQSDSAQTNARQRNSGQGATVIRAVQQRCVQCHGPKVANAGIDLSDLREDLDVWKSRFTYTKVLDMLERNAMPPEDETPLPPPLRAMMIEWFGHTLRNIDPDRIPRDPGAVRPRRLNRHEYNYTVQDLFGINAHPADAFPPDQTIGDGFDNAAATLTVEELWFEKALAAAHETVRAVWTDSAALDRLLFIRPSPPPIKEDALYASTLEEALKCDMGDGDFTVLASFTGQPGMIFLKAPPGYGFRRGSKELTLRKNSLTYRIRRGRELRYDGLELAEGKTHRVALTTQRGRATLYLDGRFLISAPDFSRPDLEDQLFKIGSPPPDPDDDEDDERGIDEDEENKHDEDKEEEADAQPDRESDSETKDSHAVTELQFFSDSLSEKLTVAFTTGGQNALALASGLFNETIPDPALHWYTGKKPPVREDLITTEHAGAEVLKRFLRQAFRRPPTEDEFARYMNLFNIGAGDGLSFDLAMRLPVTAALASPSFLFRSEAAGSGIYAVSSVEMASRLSYFLWSSAPDETLLAAGEAGTLLGGDELLRQAERMLDDDRAMRFFERFALQWLRTEGLGDTYRPDADRFPEVTDSLMAAMKREGVMVLADLFRADRPLTQLLDHDTTYMNEELAAHYGYDGVQGPEWRKVALRNSDRGGLLTQAAVLTVSSSPRRTSPVFRGKWVLEVLLGEPPPPPPANVPELPAEVETEGASLRELLAIHRSQPACAVCHNRIDPYGLTLEQYDAVGRLRDRKRDTTATLLGGQSIDGAPELKRFLLEKKRGAYVRHLTTRMLSYALGRELAFPDERPIHVIIAELRRSDWKARTLVRQIILSEPFRYRMNKAPREIPEDSPTDASASATENAPETAAPAQS